MPAKEEFLCSRGSLQQQWDSLFPPTAVMVLPLLEEQQGWRGKAGLDRKGCFMSRYVELSVLRSSSDAVGWCFPVGTQNPEHEHIAKATWTQPLPEVLVLYLQFKCGCK